MRSGGRDAPRQRLGSGPVGGRLGPVAQSRHSRHLGGLLRSFARYRDLPRLILHATAPPARARPIPISATARALDTNVPTVPRGKFWAVGSASAGPPRPARSAIWIT